MIEQEMPHHLISAHKSGFDVLKRSGILAFTKPEVHR